MKIFQGQKKQIGMTLIEIMIALLIGAFLIGGVLQIFFSAKQTYRMQEGLSRLQENGRFAMEFISRDLRIVGYQGCSSVPAANITQNLVPLPVTLPAGINRALTGSANVANNWHGDACGGSNECIVGTDAIAFHYGEFCSKLTADMATDDADILVDSCDIAADDILLISDCAQADIFTATAATTGSTQTISHGNAKNTSNSLGNAYQINAESTLFKLQSSIYFIRTGVGGQPALWKLDSTKAASGTNPAEIIEGVEDMQILYGEDTDADNSPNHYVEVSSVTNLDNVNSVRITLTLRTIDSNLTTTGDGRLRRTFSSTIALRNRLP